MDPIFAWWDGLDDLAQVAYRDGSLILLALLTAWIVSALVRRFLIGQGLDKYLRFPWATQELSSTKGHGPERPRFKSAPTTRVAGWFVAASIWAGAGWLLAALHDADSTAEAIRIALVRSWQMALIIFPILIISGWLSRTLYDLFQTPWLKAELDSLFPGTSEGGGSTSNTIAKTMCVVIYAAFFLLIPVAIAALFNISALEGLAIPAWELCARLLTALAVFAVGYLGVAWARSHAERIGGEREDEGNADLVHQVSLGIVLFTIFLTLGLLVGVSGFASGLVVVTLLVFLLWPVRVYARNVWAGMLLRIQRVKQVELDGVSFDVKTITPLATQLEREGVELTRCNWDVLTAFMQGAQRPPEGSQSNPSPTIDSKSDANSNKSADLRKR